MSVKSESYFQDKHILTANNSYMVTLPARVTNTGISADANGRKILKAGTPLYGDITARGTAFVKATTTPANAETGTPASSNATAILLKDVDVTAGAENATIILAGCVDLLKLDSATQALVDEATVAALPRIIFVKGSAV